MYENWAVVSILSIMLLSCPITSNVANQSSNLTNASVVQNVTTNHSTGNQMTVNSSLVEIQNLCLDGLRGIVSAQGYPRGSVLYCDCRGTNGEYQCTALFIDKETTATINCDAAGVCRVKSSIGK